MILYDFHHMIKVFVKPGKGLIQKGYDEVIIIIGIINSERIRFLVLGVLTTITSLQESFGRYFLFFCSLFLLFSCRLEHEPGNGLIQKGYDEVIKRRLKVLYLMKGTHIMTSNLNIEHPINIIGAGRDQTFVKGGGFDIRGTKEEGKRVDMQGMTIKGSSGNGLLNDSGLTFLCKDMTFTQCDCGGVWARNTRGRLINCVITQCYYSGILCWENALIELKGSQTKVDGNVTSGYSDGYGLKTYHTSSIIHLLFPLTKESVSTNNHNGQNYGCHVSNGASIGNTVKTVDSFEKTP